MKTFDTFIFDSYYFDREAGTIELRYSLDDEIDFTEVLTLPTADMLAHNVDEALLDRALFALHLIGGISYYKTYCPEHIRIRSGELTEEQAEFWTLVYTHGLAEFCFENNVDPDGLIAFPAERTEPLEPISFDDVHDRVLVPIGGGKDSMVTTELLKEAGIDIVFFRMGAHPLIDTLTKMADRPAITIERQIDPQLFELNHKGAMNGHVPITAYVSFVTVLMSLLYGFDYIAMSNEHSSSSANVEDNDWQVNHQWSKSLAFERMLQQYLHKYITADIDYFSLLRPMSELTITQLLCMHPEYLEHLTSCNRNWKILGEKPSQRWCGECAKCAFVYCLMAAFLPKEKLDTIFGADLFAKEELVPLYRQLLGLEGIKPFECVGTPKEVAAAFLLALKQGDWENTPAMQMFLTESAPAIEDAEQLIEDVLTISEEHAIANRFLQKIDAPQPV